MTTVSAQQASQRFTQLVEMACQNQRIRIQRGNQPVAWLVGVPLADSLSQLIDYIIKYQPALADTLAIELDPKIRQTIVANCKAIEAGDLVPLESILDD